METSKPQSVQDDFIEVRSTLATMYLGHEDSEALAALARIEEQLETLREFFDAFEEVEGGIVDFDLHNEAVMRMRAAREAVYAMTSSPAKRPK